MATNWTEINLPFKGMYRPNADVYNPLAATGYFYSLDGWKIQNNVLRFAPGEADAFSNQSLDNSTDNNWLVNYTSFYYYINGTSLRKVNGAESEIEASFWSGAPTTRSSFTFFRNRFLVANANKGFNWVDPSDDSFRAVGVAAPSSECSAAAGAAGDLVGRYRYKITYVDDQGHESNAKEDSYAEVTVTETKVSLTSIPTGPTGISYRRIYRTLSNGEQFFYLDQIDDNTTTTYTDQIDDVSLGSPLQYDNDTPPSNIRQMFSTASRIYLVDGSDGRTLWVSKIDPFTATPNWQAYPSGLSIALPYDVTHNYFQAGWELNSQIYTASRHQIHRILGDPGTGIEVKKVLDEGLFGRFSYCLTNDKVCYLNDRKRLMLWNGDDEPVDIGANIQDLLNDADEDSGHKCTTLLWDKEENAVYCFTWETPYGRAIRVNLDGGEAFDLTSELQYPYYDTYTGTIIGSRPTDSTIHGESGYKYDGAKRTYQDAEWHAIIPAPGKTTYFGRIKIEAKALPINSYVPPMLQVKLAYNDSADWTTFRIDLTKDYMIRTSSNVETRKVCYVPIYRRAESIQIKLTSLSNDAALVNGMEIYKVSVEVSQETSKQDHRVWSQDKEG